MSDLECLPIDELAAGLKFEDPYRWLENSDSLVVQEWQETQALTATKYVKKWPHFNNLQKHINHYMVGQTGLPRFARGHWFRIENNHVIKAHSPFGEGAVIVSLDSISNHTAAFLSWISPSPSGQLLAVGVCDDGSEYNTIRLINAVTREPLPNTPKQVLMDNWTGGVSWLPDNSGFYFSAFEGGAGESELAVFLFQLSGSILTQQAIPLPESLSDSYYALVTFSDEGRFHILHQNDIEPRPVAILDTVHPQPQWQSFISLDAGMVVGQIIDDLCYALTTVGAPRGRVVLIPIASEMPNDPNHWTELIPESDVVMRSMTRVDQYFYLHEFVDTYSRVRIFDFSGRCIGKVPLPDRAALVEGHYPIQHLIPKGHPEEFLFSYSTFLQSSGVYRHKFNSDELEILQAPAVRIDNAVIEDHWATSLDGTRVPYHSVRLAEVDCSMPQPTLIYAYGAFNVPWTPGYPGSMAAFIAAGGVYVHGHIRGGGELGKSWWQHGRMANKQNGYHDLYAIAEDLIEGGRTTSQQLALTGRSNGGLMAGVALAQRPDLWRVVVPQVPIFDLIGALREPYSRQVITDEFADPENPEDIARIAKYSPYHLIKEQTLYPSVYIVAGNTDLRCAAWHARKFGARLQATNSDNPVLVHIWTHAGHGQATARSIAVLQYAEWMAFIMHELGLAPNELPNS